MDYYDKTVNDIVLWHRIGAIVCHIAKKLGIPPIQALKDFYRSQTCLNLHNLKTGLYLYGDLYIADDYLIEIGAEEN